LLRVSVQLIDGTSGLAIWSQPFDRGRRELLNVQQEIAQAVADQLLPDSDPEITAPITQDATANEKLLLARHYEQQVRERENVDPELLERAIQLYREAIELDDQSALAHARLAGALMYYGDIDAAEAPAYRALELNPRLAEAQHTYGQLLFARGHPNMGEPLARAVELNPNLPDALATYAHWRWYNLGEQGVDELYRRALKLDPLNISRYGALGAFLAVNDDYAGAREVVEQMKALFDTPESYSAIAHIYDLIGEVDHAIAWMIRARDAEPHNPQHVEKLAEYFVDIGDFETAEKLTPDLGVGLLYKMRRYEEMIELAEELIFDFPEDIQLRIYLAAVYNLTERYEQALRLITSTGILNTIRNGNRGPADYNALTVLSNTAYRSGKVEQARELVLWWRETLYHGQNAYWWVSISNACNSAILGEDDEARRLLERALEANNLAWEPNLRDAACFKRFADDPAYLAVVKHFDDRRAMLRERLPATLRAYGVAL
ncbi:MAG: hypothetical protein QNJ23_03690, partial [Woeseiaceae bacterium]|nr:hypothetical protein [Woeseiaceae bacterium]